MTNIKLTIFLVCLFTLGPAESSQLSVNVQDVLTHLSEEISSLRKELVVSCARHEEELKDTNAKLDDVTKKLQGISMLKMSASLLIHMRFE